MGPFPKGAGSLSLPATQTYSDGTVVKWDQPTPAGGKEPEHPAPTLKLSSTEPRYGDAAATGQLADVDATARTRWRAGSGGPVWSWGCSRWSWRWCPDGASRLPSRCSAGLSRPGERVSR